MPKDTSNNKNNSGSSRSKSRQAQTKKAGSAIAKRVKLKPQRPVPTVHPASNVTGPRSSHVEGKNVICVTRATKLATYLRRCKSLVLDDGYAIPWLKLGIFN
ncbi:hypothetical protein FRC12_020647 [Ceratobasidium sp. 428]|nr:hypothetical protein FRC12_020647 [Ceratobasidium sp. 428]